jgi:hypothetical protein
METSAWDENCHVFPVEFSKVISLQPMKYWSTFQEQAGSCQRRSRLMKRFLLTCVSSFQSMTLHDATGRQQRPVSASIDHAWHWHTHTVDIATGKQTRHRLYQRHNYRPYGDPKQTILPSDFPIPNVAIGWPEINICTLRRRFCEEYHYWVAQNTPLVSFTFVILTVLSSSWEGVNCAHTQELPSILWNPKVYYRPLVPILSPIDLVNSIPSYPSKIHFNIFHPPTSWSS